MLRMKYHNLIELFDRMTETNINKRYKDIEEILKVKYLWAITANDIKMT